ncbi:MAG: hypothetical protein GWM88_01635, partial [Pseudomonadales bacterium]|nr:hypothetical protein [Pseudomonadales bacterium]NIX06784.1 hypothetical protein [Pseudomonadales bacterium]
ELIDPWTPRGTYEIRRSAVYQFHAATAQSWRVGRVLLAGDAAHQTPPFLGQGLNAGMRDVINLSWKLPLVLSGAVDEGLLDSLRGGAGRSRRGPGGLGRRHRQADGASGRRGSSAAGRTGNAGCAEGQPRFRLRPGSGGTAFARRRGGGGSGER